MGSAVRLNTSSPVFSARQEFVIIGSLPFGGVLKGHGTRQANPNRAEPCMFCFGSIERLSLAVSSYLPGDACPIVFLNLTLPTFLYFVFSLIINELMVFILCNHGR